MRGLVNFRKEPYSAELRELPVPEIGEDDLLISVRAVGVCGSDLHQYAGTHSWPVNYPVVLGHGSLFFHEGESANLRLVAAKTFARGIVKLTFEPQSAAA